MTTKRIHFPQTTAQQRKLLFETWEATGNVTEACRKAHVGRGTFYYWKPRFDKYGYAGWGCDDRVVAHLAAERMGPTLAAPNPPGPIPQGEASRRLILCAAICSPVH